jgi:hypothetical protein
MHHPRIITISILCILLVAGLSCAKGSNNGMPSPTPTLSPTISPTVPPTVSPTLSPTPTATLGPEGCQPDRDAIQVALNAYHAENGDWPTADGDPGDIKWSKLVPEFLPYIPHTDDKCDWQVNSDPEGEICLWERC